MTNLIVMTLIWLTCSFNFYLIQFLLTSFNQVYISTIFSCVSDMVGYSTGGLIFAQLGVKKTQLLGFSIATIGGLIILFVGLKHQDSWVFPVLIFFAKYGVTLSFGLNYASNSYLFPTLFAATAIGLCNTMARLFSAVSPIISQIDEPVPMILFTCSSAVTMIFIFFLNVPKKSPDELLSSVVESIVGVAAEHKDSIVKDKSSQSTQIKQA